MNAKQLDLPGVMLIEPKVFKDERGYFFESFNLKSFFKNDLNYEFVQDNQSKSSYGTLRGLHFQTGEFAQAKLVRVVSGKVLDVVVDIRKSSVTYGKHLEVILDSELHQQLLVPRGFAHGFVTLSQEAIFEYKVDNYYNAAAEKTICFDDPQLNINWILKTKDILLSDKDQRGLGFNESEEYHDINHRS